MVVHSTHLNKGYSFRQHRDVGKSPQRRAAVLQLLLLLHVGVQHNVAHVCELDVVLHDQTASRRGEENTADVGRHDEGGGPEHERERRNRLVGDEIDEELNRVQREGTTHHHILCLEVRLTDNEPPDAVSVYASVQTCCPTVGGIAEGCLAVVLIHHRLQLRNDHAVVNLLIALLRALLHVLVNQVLFISLSGFIARCSARQRGFRARGVRTTL